VVSRYPTFEDWFDARELAHMHVEDDVSWVIDRQESKRLMVWLRAAFDAGRAMDDSDQHQRRRDYVRSNGEC